MFIHVQDHTEKLEQELGLSFLLHSRQSPINHRVWSVEELDARQHVQGSLEVFQRVLPKAKAGTCLLLPPKQEQP